MAETASFSSWRGIDDIVIVGGGLAGLFCALKLAPRPVTVLTAAAIGESTSSGWAQGGIAAAMAPGDSVAAHVADTIAAGAGLVDEKVARIMAEDASDCIHDLLSYGVPFDQDLKGHLTFSQEAAHSNKRIVHVRGDMAGAAIMNALIHAVNNTPSIRILDGFVAERIHTKDGYVSGIVAQDLRGGLTNRLLLPAQTIVLSTGGIGGLYSVTTNPAESCGEGIAMAVRAGAILVDMEFVQFHPTALRIEADPKPLITEAIRGEGAHLINNNGQRFMLDVHPDAELAPRDIVARAIHAQLQNGQGAFLDARHSIGQYFPEQFPTVYRACVNAGINPVKEPIPVAPAAHYHMGGVHVDINGRTSVNGLWACGEVASTGAHGANRLASNSLLEAIVFAKRIANDIQGVIPKAHSDPNWEQAPDAFANPIDTSYKAPEQMRRIMFDHVSVMRTSQGLKMALRQLYERSQTPANPREANMILAAQAVTLAALMRKESRGCHYRTDFPHKDARLQKRNFIKMNDLDQVMRAL